MLRWVPVLQAVMDAEAKGKRTPGQNSHVFCPNFTFVTVIKYHDDDNEVDNHLQQPRHPRHSPHPPHPRHPQHQQHQQLQGGGVCLPHNSRL